MKNSSWLMKLAYLADIFTKLNDVCLSLQGKSITVFNVKNKISGFSRKLEFWVECIEKGNVSCFATLSDFQIENNIFIDEDLRTDITQHLRTLKENLQKYFPTSTENIMWVENPFIITAKPDALTGSEYESLIEISSESNLKSSFDSVSLTVFWCNISDEYPVLSRRAMRVLLPFTTTYLCETGFSLYTATKTKYRSRLNCSPEMRIQLTTIKPNINRICQNKNQQHTSH